MLDDSFSCRSLIPYQLDSPHVSQYDQSLDFPLSEYEIQALLQLGVESYSKGALFAFSFQGLKRRLGIHQQKLTKALKRLIQKGLIQKSDDMYLLTANGATILSRMLIQCPFEHMDTLSHKTSVQMAIEQGKISPDKFLQLLSGKWFGDFRFIGQAENKGRVIVQFSNQENSVHACCCLSQNQILRVALTSNSESPHILGPEDLKEIVEYLQRIFQLKTPTTIGTCGMKRETPVDLDDLSHEISIDISSYS